MQDGALQAEEQNKRAHVLPLKGHFSGHRQEIFRTAFLRSGMRRCGSRVPLLLPPSLSPICSTLLLGHC
jgi:hypothetical protein